MDRQCIMSDVSGTSFETQTFAYNHSCGQWLQCNRTRGNAVPALLENSTTPVPNPNANPNRNPKP